MARSGSRDASAAWAVALALWIASAVGPAAPVDPDCAAPRELSGENGHSIAVGCDDPSVGVPLRGPARVLFGLPIDPNRADAATLESLPGIGPVRARAILDERGRRPFESVAALERVKGIGPVTLARIAPWLAVSGEPLGAGLP